MHELTFEEAVDVVAAVTRNIAANHATIVALIPGREAERVATSLHFEGGQLTEALSALRKMQRETRPVEPIVEADPYRYEQDRKAEHATRANLDTYPPR
jgi:hypothetical protein